MTKELAEMQAVCDATLRALRGEYVGDFFRSFHMVQEASAIRAERDALAATRDSLLAENEALGAARDSAERDRATLARDYAALVAVVRKVRGHTSYLPAAPYALLAGLLQSIERIAYAALLAHPRQADTPHRCACGPSDVCRDEGCQCECHQTRKLADTPTEDQR